MASAQGENWTALPQWFKQAGFQSLGGGKIYHPNNPPNNDQPCADPCSCCLHMIPAPAVYIDLRIRAPAVYIRIIRYSWDTVYLRNGDDKGCRKNETIYR